MATKAKIIAAELAHLLDNDVRCRSWERASKRIAEGAVPLERTLRHAVYATEENGVMDFEMLDWTEKLLDAGAKGASAVLGEALFSGRESAAVLLLRAGAKVSLKTRVLLHHNYLTSTLDRLSIQADYAPADTPLYKAILRGDFEKAQALAAETVPDKRAMLLAVRNLDRWPNEDMAQWTSMLLAAGGQPTAEMFMIAEERHSRPVSVALLKAGLVPDNDMMMYAAKHRDAYLMQKLVDAGGKATSDVLFAAIDGLKEPTSWDRIYASEYSTASWSPNKDTALILLAAGAVPDDRTMNYAADRLDLSWVKMFHEAGGNATSMALRLAIGGVGPPYNADLVKYLVDAGAVPDLSSLMAPCLHDDIRDMLVGATGLTPALLREAVETESYRAISILTEGGVVPDRATVEAAKNLEGDWAARLDAFNKAATILRKDTASAKKLPLNPRSAAITP